MRQMSTTGHMRQNLETFAFPFFNAFGKGRTQSARAMGMEFNGRKGLADRQRRYPASGPLDFGAGTGSRRIRWPPTSITTHCSGSVLRSARNSLRSSGVSA